MVQLWARTFSIAFLVGKYVAFDSIKSSFQKGSMKFENRKSVNSDLTDRTWLIMCCTFFKTPNHRQNSSFICVILKKLSWKQFKFGIDSIFQPKNRNITVIRQFFPFSFGARLTFFNIRNLIRPSQYFWPFDSFSFFTVRHSWWKYT